MNNSPELNGKYLGSITTDFVKISDTLKEASYQIIQKGISNYPIFVFCKQQTSIGLPLIINNEQNLLWNVNASFLSEFTQRQLIENETAFKETYKDTDEFCCLFVIDYDFTNFVFLPYPEDD